MIKEIVKDSICSRHHLIFTSSLACDVAWIINMDTPSTVAASIVSNVLFVGIGHVNVVSLCHPCEKQQNTPCLSSLCTVQCLWHWSKDKHPGNPSVLVTQNNFLQDHSHICLCVYISFYHCRGGGHWVVWDNKMLSSATTLSRRPSDWRLLRLQTKSPVRTRTRMKSGACQHDHNFSMSAPHASTINPTCPFRRRIQHCQNQRFAKPFCKLGELPLCKHGCLPCFSWSLQFSTSTGALPLPNW